MLRISLGVTMLYVVLLVVAGIRAHSLALLSEAGHNLSDFLALLLSLVAVYLEGRPPSATKTYGYRRAGVLAALVNSLSLVVVSFFIFYEAFRRIQHPEQVRAAVMIWVAAAGVVMNGAIALLLWRSGRDVNVRSALLHEVGDTLSTAAVIVGGLAILWTGQYLDRFGVVVRDRRPDLVVELRDRARDAEHSAGRYAARDEPGGGGVDDADDRGRERCARSASVEHWVGKSRALGACEDCRHGHFGERLRFCARSTRNLGGASASTTRRFSWSTSCAKRRMAA